MVLVVLCAGCGSKAKAPGDTTTAKAKALAQERSQSLDDRAFRCLHSAMTTFAMLKCENDALSRADSRIRARVKVIAGLMSTRGKRRLFARSERLWIRYRDASCEAEASAYEGGSAQPQNRSLCEVMRSKGHLKELA